MLAASDAGLRSLKTKGVMLLEEVRQQLSSGVTKSA